MASQRSRLAADWEASPEEIIALRQAHEEVEEELDDGEVDPRWVKGGKSYQRFSPYATDEEEAQAKQGNREQRAWDPDAPWVKEMLQPAEIGSIPRAKGTRNNRRRHHRTVIVLPKHTDRIDDNPAQECVKLYRFRARLSPGEHYFYEIRPGYALIVVRRYLEEIRENGFERRDMRKRYMTEGVSRTRRLAVYVEEQELRELAVCPGGTMRALAQRARAEDPTRVASVDLLAKRPKTQPVTEDMQRCA
jgi:hypothetical protein